MNTTGTRALACIVLLTAFAAVTRLVGIDYLLPNFQEPDQYLVPQAEFLWEGGDPKAAPLSFFWYYSLLPQLLALRDIPAVGAAAGGVNDLTAQLAAASEPVVRVRLLVAWLSVLAIPGTFLLARRLLGARRALFAAALLSTSFLFLVFSSQARPHAAQTTLALFAVLAALRLRARPTIGGYALAGVAAALAVGCLQNGVFVLPPLFVAHLLRRRDDGPAAWRRRPLRGAALFALALAPIAASLLWFGPAFNEEQEDRRTGRAPFGRPETVIVQLDRESYNDPLVLREGAIELGPQRLVLEWFDGSGFPRSVTFLWWNDPVMVALGAVGLLALAAAAARRARASRGARGLAWLDRFLDRDATRDALVVLAYAGPYALVLGSYARTWGRFLLPVLPHLACAAALGGGALLAIAARRAPALSRVKPAAGLALLALALPTWAAAHRAWVTSRPDTLERAAAWVAENVDPASQRVLTGTGLTLPLFYRRDALDSDLMWKAGQYVRWQCYQDLFLPPRTDGSGFDLRMVAQRADVREQLSTVAGATRLLKQSGADFVAIEVSQRTRLLREMRSLFEALERRGELVARFEARSPEENDLLFMDYQDAPQMVWRSLRARALGPRIEIYALPRPERGGG